MKNMKKLKIMKTDLFFQLLRPFSEKISSDFNGFYPVQDVFEICRINRLAISERLIRNFNRATRDSSWSCYESFDDNEILDTSTVFIPTRPFTFTDPQTVVPVDTTEQATAPPTRPPTIPPTLAATTSEATTVEETTTSAAATTTAMEPTTTPEITTVQVTTESTTVATTPAPTEELCLGDCVRDTETPPTDNGYGDEFLAQFQGIHFARSAHGHWAGMNSETGCVYKVGSTENYKKFSNVELDHYYEYGYTEF